MKNNLEPTSATTGRGRTGTGLLFALIIIVIAAVLWLAFGKNNNAKPSTNPAPKSQTNQQTGNTQLDSLISYKLPTDWTDTDCISATETILVIPASQPRPNCAIDLQNWSLKIVMDTHNTTNCNQIKVDNSQVTNHVCSSVPVNGQRFLKSSTTFNDKSPYGHPTKVADYYIKTNKGVIKLEYIDNLTSSSDDFQAGFDQLANSIQVKNS